MIRYVITVCCFIITSTISLAQNDKTKPEKENITSLPPFKILTAGKKITIQSKSNIRKLILWTASGHRVVEETGLNTSSYSYTITISEKIFFLMLELADGKRYTEKIGVQ